MAYSLPHDWTHRKLGATQGTLHGFTADLTNKACVHARYINATSDSGQDL